MPPNARAPCLLLTLCVLLYEHGATTAGTADMLALASDFARQVLVVSSVGTKVMMYLPLQH